MLKVHSIQELKQITDCKAGTPAAVEIRKDRFKMYVFDGAEWKPQTGKSGIAMSYYDINKQIVAQQPDYDWSKVNETYKLLEDFVNKTKNNYYMLLSRENNYFTIFHIDLNAIHSDIWCEVMDVVKNTPDIFTTLKAVNEADGGIEFWYQDTNKEVHVAYLFPYDMGVIECN